MSPLAHDPRGLQLDVGGKLYEIKPEEPPSPRGHYALRNGAAELVLNRLAAHPLWLRLSLGGDFVTDIGVFGLQVATEKLEACRGQ